MNRAPDQVLLKQYTSLGRIAAAVVFLLSGLILAGWASGQYDLVRLLPDPAYLGFSEAGRRIVQPLAGQTNSTSAICLAVLSVSLLLISLKAESARLLLYAVRAFSFLVLAACAVGIFNEVTGEDLLFIRFLQPEPAAPGISFPNPVVIPEALSVAALSLSLLFFSFGARFRLIYSILALASCLVPILIIMGFATGSPQLCALGGCFRLSVGFSLLMIIQTGATIMLDRDSEFMSFMSNRSSSGKLLRRAFLLAVLLPALLLLRSVAASIQTTGGHPLIDTGLSWAITGLLFLVLLISLAYSGAVAVRSAEEKAVEQLEQAETPPPAKLCSRCNREEANSKSRCTLCYGELIEIERPAIVGTLFADRYMVEEHMGEGGMARVYRARHTVLDVPVALKVLKADLQNYAVQLERFKREGKAASLLTHPAVVRILDYGLSKWKQPYLAMEYIEGETLDSVLERINNFPLNEAADLIAQIAEALSQAHGAGIVHRDLKPDNILLIKSADSPALTVKLVDFGIAWFLEDPEQRDSGQQRLTQTGTTIGSPLFMSPEQCKGLDVDERSDIYSLGCLSFLMLTGLPPIMGETAAATMIAHVTEAPMDFPHELGIPQQVCDVLLKAMKKRKEERHKSVLEFREELLQAVQPALKSE